MKEAFSEEEIRAVLDAAEPLLAAQPQLVRIPANRAVVIIGDLHGDSEAQRIVLEKFPKHHKLYLGDLIDRAPENGSSLATLVLALETKIKDPENTTLLRGNHEFRSVWERYGFSKSLGGYGLKQLSQRIEDVVSQFSYGALLESRGVIAFHGGFPNVENTEEVNTIPKGVKDYGRNIFVNQIVWSDIDPTLGTTDALQEDEGLIDNMDRMAGTVQGEPFLSEQLRLFGANVLVRGHEQSIKGPHPSGKVLTVFTASQYTDIGYQKGRFVGVVKPRQTIKTAQDIQLIDI